MPLPLFVDKQLQIQNVALRIDLPRSIFQYFAKKNISALHPCSKNCIPTKVIAFNCGWSFCRYNQLSISISSLVQTWDPSRILCSEVIISESFLYKITFYFPISKSNINLPIYQRSCSLLKCKPWEMVLNIYPLDRSEVQPWTDTWVDQTLPNSLGWYLARLQAQCLWRLMFPVDLTSTCRRAGMDWHRFSKRSSDGCPKS